MNEEFTSHDEENRKPINPLSEEELRERMNFSKMMARQEKQIQQTPHIKALLTAKENQEPFDEQSLGHIDLKSRIERLEDHYNMKEINQRFDQISEKLEQKINPIKKIRFNFSIKNKRQAYYLGSLFILSALIIGIVSKPETTIKLQEKIIYKTKAVPKKFFMTKYVNIRTHASTSAKKLATLAPNSIFEVLQEEKNWKKIKYIDHVNKTTLIGWAYGENLGEIKTQ